MNTLLLLRRRLLPSALLLVLVITPALLYLPALYYSLDTPFALVDDYTDRRFYRDYGSWERIPKLVERHILGTRDHRYRPFWAAYTPAAWYVYGERPWLHHLGRWAFHFGAALMFIAAFWRITNKCTGGGRIDGLSRPAAPNVLTVLLPLALLAYCWLFFPNVPAARLTTMEVYTAFFLGLCSWMAALLLTGDCNSDGSGGNGNGKRRRWTRRLQYGLLTAGFIGLLAAKEVNIAPALWLITAYCAALLIRRNDSWPSALSGVPLAVIFLLVLDQVYDATRHTGVGYGVSLTAAQFRDNAQDIISGLFMVETSPIVSAGFAILAAALLIILAVRVVTRQFDNRTLFMLFLLGLFASIFAILCASYGVALRYWYTLIPVFAMLLAFAAQILLELIHDRWRRLLPAAAAAVIGFILFFAAVNYYNFLLQTTIQHSARHSDARVINEISRLLDHGKYVQINPNDMEYEPVWTLANYFEGLTQDAGRYGYRLHTAPPADPASEYYIVDFHQRDYPMAVHQDIAGREDYPILAHTQRIAGALQFQADAPYRWNDAGAHYPHHYRWIIYNGPTDARAWLEQLLPQAGPSIIRSDWNVHRSGRNLTYIKKKCTPADTKATFLLHIIPADPADLPAERQRYGYDARDFRFDQAGAMGDGVCAAIARLPDDYPVAGIRAGQYSPDAGVIWESAAAIDTWELYAARPYLQRLRARAGAPIVRTDWQVYRNGRRLTYLKEQCSPADAATPFMLQVIPAAAGAAGLPAWWRPHNFGNPHFSIAADGAAADGTCAVLVRLPDYPVAAIRTGQYAPDGGAMWQAQVSIATASVGDAGYWLRRLLDQAGPLIIRSNWNVHYNGRNLTYIKEKCSPVDTEVTFLLHIIPADPADLPAQRRRYGFDARDFSFDHAGAMADGVCAVLARLPNYPIASISAGQYSPDAGVIWQAAIGLSE